MGRGSYIEPLAWTEEDVAELRSAYFAASHRGELNLGALASKFGRSKPAICRKARMLGLTGKLLPHPPVSRAKYATEAERRAATAEARRLWLAENGHPRGMAGKRHSDKTKDSLRASSLAFRASLSSDQAGEIAGKAMRTRAKNGGSAPQRPSATWKAGWREIGGDRKYYRSRWEANYARYLNWLQHKGEILDWKHEPETFWFDTIKRGVRSYLPDFRVWEMDGSSKLHEVKGWMDARSRTTLKRMAKYHPGETIILVKEKEYRAIERAVGRLIEGWE